MEIFFLLTINWKTLSNRFKSFKRKLFFVYLICSRPVLDIISFVNLKSNSALFYSKDHNLLTSAFPPNNSSSSNIS